MNKVIKAIEDIKNGKMVIVVDHEDRENEGDFIISAEKATAENINFMMKYGRGLICMPITNKCAKRLELDPMVSSNTSVHETNFTVSVDAIKNATTGISAQDRWQTVQIILDKKSVPKDLGRPGHLFPIVGKDGGVLQRAGHTEASMDLCKLANLERFRIYKSLERVSEVFSKIPVKFGPSDPDFVRQKSERIQNT